MPVILFKPVTCVSTATGEHAKKNASNGNRDAGRQSHRKRRVHQSLQGGVEPGREDVRRVPDGGRNSRPREETPPGHAAVTRRSADSSLFCVGVCGERGQRRNQDQPVRPAAHRPLPPSHSIGVSQGVHAAHGAGGLRAER